MKRLVLSGAGIVIGKDSIEYLKTIQCKKAFVVTGGNSMIKYGVIKKIEDILQNKQIETYVYSGIRKNPAIDEVMDGVEKMNQFKPDMVIAVGGGSALDAAKGMLLFYEFPFLNFDNVLQMNSENKIPSERQTGLICIPSTSGTASEVTRGTVITDPKRSLKVPVMTDCLRPDFAILDASLTMTMPKQIVAETGMDALTHAIEAYINHNLDEINKGLCGHAITGIMKWLIVSYEECSYESREKIHMFQAMAGIGFANVGLGMVHGIAHSYGAIFDMAHGLTNSIILPYALDFNKKDPKVAEKLNELSYMCRTKDIIEEIKILRERLNIPGSFRDAGVNEGEFNKEYELLVSHAMLGATRVNPVYIDEETMRKLVKDVYYGTAITY